MPNAGSNAGLAWEVHPFGRLYAFDPPTGLNGESLDRWPIRHVDQTDFDGKRWLYAAPDGAKHTLHSLPGRDNGTGSLSTAQRLSFRSWPSSRLKRKGKLLNRLLRMYKTDAELIRRAIRLSEKRRAEQEQAQQKACDGCGLVHLADACAVEVRGQGLLSA